MDAEGRGDEPLYETFDIEEMPLDPDSYGSKLRSASPETSKFSKRGKAKGKTHQEVVILRWFILVLSIVTALVFAVLYVANSGSSSKIEASAAAHTGYNYENGFNMKQNWGSYSPYFDTGVPFDHISQKANEGGYPINMGCKLKQVHVLHRHGDRFPSDSTAKRMKNVVDKLSSMEKSNLPQSMQWLHHWKYLLHEELLVGAGVGALFESGAKFWGSHGRLLYGETAEDKPAWSDKFNVGPDGERNPKPILRATTQQRIQDSARAWAAGFFGTYGYPSSGIDPLQHYDLVLMDESPGHNNSMAAWFACPNSLKAKKGKHLSKTWVNTSLADAALRIQKLLPDYDAITPNECLGMQDICVFETAAYGSSPFCGLFTEQEWRSFEYHVDLKFYEQAAWGSPLGPTTGVPWLTELHALLKGKLIHEAGNGINVTLDSNNSTFPIHQPFTVDFSHDTSIVSVLSALEFPFTMEKLTSDKIKVPRQLIISRLTPFAARLYVELFSCGEGANESNYIRLKLNDRVLPIGDLKHCSDDDQMGLTPLSDFLEQLDFVIGKTEFDKKCYGENDII